jgi:hypothetical protein
MFLNAGANVGDKVTAVTGNSEAPTVAMYWTLHEVDTQNHYYTLRSTQYNLYLSKASGSATMVEKEAEAGRYKILPGTNTSMSKGSNGDTYNMTYYIYFMDADTGNGFDTNASKNLGSGPFSLSVTNNVVNNPNAYYTAVKPTVDIADATESVWSNLDQKIIYIIPNPNQSNFTNNSICYVSAPSLANIGANNWAYGVTMNNGKRCMWQLEAADKYASYRIKNVATGYYVGVPANNQIEPVSLTSNVEEAGVFTALKKDVLGTNDGISFQCTTVDKCFLEMRAVSPYKFSAWYDNGINSKFAFQEVSEATLNGENPMTTQILPDTPMFLKNTANTKYLSIVADRTASYVERYTALSDTVVGWHSAWTFKPISSGKYVIYNTQRKVYLGKTDQTAVNQTVPYTFDERQAGTYEIIDPQIGGTYCGFMDTENPTYGYLKLSGNNIVNCDDFDYAFIPEKPHDVITSYRSPGHDIILSPQQLGMDGYTNLYSEFNTILGEKADGIWKGVWTLCASPYYARKNDGKENYNLVKETTDDGVVLIKKDDYPDMAYTLYNRVEELYIKIDGGVVTTTSNATDATLFKVKSNDSDETVDGHGTLALFQVCTHNDDDTYSEQQKFLSFDGKKLVPSTTGGFDAKDNCAFYLREATNTSYEGIYEGANIEFFPYRLQSRNLRMYVKWDTEHNPNEYDIWHEFESDAVDPGAYTVWTLEKCKEADARTNASSLTDDDLVDTYYMYNAASKLYMGPIRGNNVYTKMVSKREDAGRYKFMPDDYQMNAINAYDVDWGNKNSGGWMNCSVTSNGGQPRMVGWERKEDNRVFFVDNSKQRPETATSVITDGAYITMTPWNYKGDQWTHPDAYNEKGGKVYETNGTLNCDNYDDLQTKQIGASYYTWKVVAATDDSGAVIPDVYYFVNVATGNYMASTTDNGSSMTTVPAGANGEIPSGAGRFTPVVDNVTGLYVAFRDYDTTLGEDASTYGYIQNDVTNGTISTGTLAADVNLSEYNNGTYTGQVYNPDSGEYEDMSFNYPKYSHTNDWYFIEAIDIETENVVSEEYLDWIIGNLNPESGRTVGCFDSLELTGISGPLVKKVGDDYVIDNATERQLTFEELVNLVMYNYKNQETIKGDATKQGQADAALKELLKCVKDEEYIVHPRIGRFYTIHSPYGMFDSFNLRETYVNKHFESTQLTQKPHFIDKNASIDVASSYWRFDLEDNAETNSYKDKDACHYFKIRAVNSRDVLRRLTLTDVADTRSASDLNIGLFTLRKDFNLNVYPKSVLLRSHANTDDRFYEENGAFLGVWVASDATDATEAVIRSGSDNRVPAQSKVNVRPDDNANNWTITEVTEVPISFKDLEDMGTPTDVDTNSGKQYYYNAFCFPFKVEIPANDGFFAYTAVDGTSTDNTVSFKKADYEVIPAFCPFVLESTKGITEATLKIVYGAGEEYGLYSKSDKYRTDDWAAICKLYGISAVSREQYLADVEEAEKGQPWSMTTILKLDPYQNGETATTSSTEISKLRYNSDNSATVVGNVTPKALESGESTYVIHDDCNNVASYVVEGANKNVFTSDEALSANVMSSYVIPCNTAVLVLPTTEPLIIDEPITSGVEEVTTEIVNEPGRDANGNLIYFDLYGRRVMNPAPGIYILTNGQKVVVR